MVSFQRRKTHSFRHLVGMALHVIYPLQAPAKEGIEGLADPRDHSPVLRHHVVVLTGPTRDPGPGVVMMTLWQSWAWEKNSLI